MIRTEPCPAMPDGSPRQCGNCVTDIAVGAPSAQNKFGVFVHPTCPAPTPSPREAARRARQTSTSVDEDSGVARVTAALRGQQLNEFSDEPGDLGDAIVARLEVQRSGLPTTRVPNEVARNHRGSQEPASALRGNPSEQGDLGDQVVARLEAARGISREKGRNVQ
jgi:hypothetical protein